MKRARKSSSISIFDYPRNNYSAYWEYVVVEKPNGFDFDLRLIEYGTGEMKEAHKGSGFQSEDEARLAAQEVVKGVIENYRRPEPLERIADVEKFVTRFDELRALTGNPELAAQAFSEIDRIRGMLKANGVVLEEGESIGYEGKTSWRVEA